MYQILVPTDFSPEAHNAFEVATHLAYRTGGHITLLHVIDAPRASGIITTGGTAGAAPMNDVFMMQLLQRTKRHMHELMAEVARTHPEVPVQDRIAIGSDVDEQILDMVRELHIDMVVIGAHVHTPAAGVLASSSHAERLIRLAPCPVLTVKHPAPTFEVRSIVFASDFSAEADRAVPGLRQLCAAFPEATLHLLDVVTTTHHSTMAIERIHSFASRHQLVRYEPDVFSAPRVSTGIPRYVEQSHADLVVMLTHGHSGLWHFLQGSIAESVAVQTNAPVLTLHA